MGDGFFKIERYTAERAAEWDAFVAASKNGTFLFCRRYMDYHADRFTDHSLMFRKDDGSLYAVLPGNLTAPLPSPPRGDNMPCILGRSNCTPPWGEQGGGSGVFYSHQGLTYGGLVMSEACTTADVCQLFCDLNDYLRAEGITRVVYKAVPWIYHRLPSEEDLFAIVLKCHARLISRDVSSAIIPRQPVKWKRDRRYAANKAHTNGLTVSRSDDYDSFWQILTDNLRERHGAQPIHTADEIKRLHGSFPDNIQLWTTHHPDGRMLAGTVLYVNRATVHAQYISATPEGKHLHAVDILYEHIIRRAFADADIIDLGTSNMPHSNDLHDSLIHQKEGFGGRAVCYDTYEWGAHPRPLPKGGE